MKRFIRKRLPAVLLALVLVLGMVPAASAACTHNNWSSWTKADDETHERVCKTSGCNEVESAKHTWAATYSTNGTYHWKVCTACGAENTREQHKFAATLKSDSTGHWEECTVCGYKANKGGHIDENLDSKCDTCGYSTGSPYITVTFKNGSSTYETQGKVLKGGMPTNPGTPSKSGSGKKYTFKGWTTTNPGSSAVYSGQSYLTSAQVAKTAVSSNTTYYALYTVTSSTSTTITYEVDPGEAVTFNRGEFKEIFDDACDNDTFRYVVFSPTTSNYKSSYGLIYYDYEGSDEENFTKKELENSYFYYSSAKYGDYPLKSISFVADADADDRVIEIPFTLCGDDEEVEGILEIEIGKGKKSSKADVVYEVDAGDSVSFSRTDFKEFYEDEYDDDTFRYVVLSPDSTLKASNGVLYYDYDSKNEEKFSKSTLDDYEFYYKSGDYLINKLTFVADEDADGAVVTMEFRAYGDDDYLDGTLEIRVGDVDDDDDEKGDINYTVEPGEAVEFNRSDFNSFLKDEESKSVRWVTFYPTNSYKSIDGAIYYDYDGKDEEEFTKADLEDETFYYSSDAYGNYPLDELSFVADDDFEGPLTLKFRAWYSEDIYADGTLVIQSEATTTAAKGSGDILYSTTYSSSVQISHNDFARFFKKQYPNSTLQYVKITSVPTSGSLYYDYYGTSKYGSKVRLTSDNCKDYSFYFSPDSTKQYALSELSFTPNGFNYCPVISFTAYGSGSKSVSGNILISVTLDSVPEVYGVTPKGTPVNFPASSLASAVSKGTGLTLGSIRLLTLPDATQGAVYVGSGTSTKANTSDLYSYSSGARQISQLRFVPASGFTGSVELPYVAYNTAGNAVASGKFCLGVLSSKPSFSDVTSSTWCYKYVMEMSDAKVISGYTDGTFRPNNTVTYGQALKLIMLAAGYSEQSPTDSHWASGYLTKAKADKLITGTVNLDAPMTRLAVAQVAAKAMKLSTSDLSSVKPFTDTSDVYVQALNAAGIVEGYFSSGTSTFKPSNTLTRGQISAIVWRMQNYNQ